MKGRSRRHNNVASSCCRRRERNKINSSKHWRFKGRRKKGITSVKILQGALDRGHTGARCFQPHTGRNRRENQQKTTIAMVIYSIGNTQQEEIKATFPAAQNILEIGSGPRIHPAQLLVDAVICLLILHAVCRSKRTQHQIQM